MTTHDGSAGDGGPVVRLGVYDGAWAADDADANFRAEVAAYSLQEPLATLERMAENLDIPVGALARYVLVKWATGGAEGVLELGPSTVARMCAAAAAAEELGTDEARLTAYRQLAAMAGWLGSGLDAPDVAYPDGGAPAPKQVRRVGAYGVIVDPSDRVLLVRVAAGWKLAGSWTLPGGGLLHGESGEDAAVREIAEETGVVPRLGRMLGTDSVHLLPDASFKGDDFHALRLLYEASVDADATLVAEQDESTDEVAWIARVAVADLPRLELVDRGLELYDRAR